jgi:hypothetical protein
LTLAQNPYSSGRMIYQNILGLSSTNDTLTIDRVKPR